MGGGEERISRFSHLLAVLKGGASERASERGFLSLSLAFSFPHQSETKPLLWSRIASLRSWIDAGIRAGSQAVHSSEGEPECGLVSVSSGSLCKTGTISRVPFLAPIPPPFSLLSSPPPPPRFHLSLPLMSQAHLIVDFTRFRPIVDVYRRGFDSSGQELG